MNCFWVMGMEDESACVCFTPYFFKTFNERFVNIDVDLLIPLLDGTIFPGLTRASMLALAEAHSTGEITLPRVPTSVKFHTHERPLTMGEIDALSTQGRILGGSRKSRYCVEDHVEG